MQDDMTGITLAGNVGDDPSLRYTKAGKPVTNLRIARSRRPAVDGTERPTEWFNVEVYGDLAINVAKSVTKGNRVVAVCAPVIRHNPNTGPNGEIYPNMSLIAEDVAISMKWYEAKALPNQRPAQQNSSQSNPLSLDNVSEDMLTKLAAMLAQANSNQQETTEQAEAVAVTDDDDAPF